MLIVRILFIYNFHNLFWPMFFADNRSIPQLNFLVLFFYIEFFSPIFL